MLFGCELILATPTVVTAVFVVIYGVGQVSRIEKEGNAGDTRLQAVAKKISRMTCVLGTLFLAKTVATIVAAISHWCGSMLTPPQYSLLRFSELVVSCVSFLIILFYHGNTFQFQLNSEMMHELEAQIRESFKAQKRRFAMQSDKDTPERKEGSAHPGSGYQRSTHCTLHQC